MNVILSGDRPAEQRREPGNAETFLRRFHAEQATLPGDRAVRQRAADWLEQHGLPRRSVEGWKYTDLKPLWSGAFGVDGSAGVLRLDPVLADQLYSMAGPRFQLPDAGVFRRSVTGAPPIVPVTVAPSFHSRYASSASTQRRDNPYSSDEPALPLKPGRARPWNPDGVP